ncbi:MAG TPA: hypothetical protein VHC91_14570 [Trinickia sp.]|uniref:hypothetical protein n=1 Tax=Trinickia sp. TaxID=2571163 RepID=UPI002C629AC0|nr:hypothetical protein [Trinickia sp.]HVW51598.1 hypothetical protein [Trinickia sp.]
MVTAEVDVTPVQTTVKGLERADIHRVLRDADGLVDLLSDFNCAEAAKVVDDLAAHLRSATHVDAARLIVQLALLCAEEDKPGQSSMCSLSRAVVAFVVDCMRFVAANDTEFVLVEFVSTASLVCGYDVLLKIGHVHRSVCTRSSGDVGSAAQSEATAKAVEHATEIWLQRANRVLSSSDAM